MNLDASTGLRTSTPALQHNHRDTRQAPTLHPAAARAITVRTPQTARSA